MKPFQLLHPTSVQEAVQALADAPGETKVLAGGTDLLGEMKEGITAPRRLVSLSGIPELHELRLNGTGLFLGAAVRLAQMEADTGIAPEYAVLTQAAASIATPQIRQMGTLGGNLCQRPRCLYYRSSLFPCLKKGGRECFVVLGESRYSAVLGGNPCFIVHPSDLAPALIALDARAHVAGTWGEGDVPLEKLYLRPRDNLASETSLGPGDLVTGVSVPAPPPRLRSAYLKVRVRQAEDFALVSVAAAVAVEENSITYARIVLGGVAPIPWRAVASEEALAGCAPSDVELGRVGELALGGAVPLRHNGYKVTLARNLVKRALRQLLTEQRN